MIQILADVSFLLFECMEAEVVAYNISGYMIVLIAFTHVLFMAEVVAYMIAI